MSIEAMKQALEALDNAIEIIPRAGYTAGMQRQAAEALRQAIEFEEMVKKGTKAWDGTPDDWVDDMRGGAEPVAFVSGYTNGECVVMPMNRATVFSVGTAFYTAPVHASDTRQECVDETAKRKHEWVGLDNDIPGLGLVTEEFYNGMLCAEDILRKRNT